MCRRSFFLFLANELDRAIERNNLAARSASRRFGADLYVAILAPFSGSLVAAGLAAPTWRQPVVMAFSRLAAVALLRLLIRLSGTDRGWFAVLQGAEGLDEIVQLHRFRSREEGIATRRHGRPRRGI
ncbi:hypothetical protein ACLF3G_03535 [Falsiroseomonas sp. HC035]|uniref:hypothetical protein n=1 Tax=Falsiroseomonas sp. HC035 TaxID=3390999 RepID=UPI003D3186B3